MTIEAVRLIGPGVDRVDGPLKVTGTAAYPGDFSYPDMGHAVLVRATVAAGRIRGVQTTAAEAAPGVLAVITHRNAPHLNRGPDTPFWRQPPPPLQDDRILHYGQYVGVVVAETAEEANAAGRLIEVDYEATEPLLELDDPRAEVVTDPWGMDAHRGNVAAGLTAADVTVDAVYTTPDETNNPMGLFATVAVWVGDSLTVHDSSQWPQGVRATLAAAFGVPESGIRVLVPFVGGGFGAGLSGLAACRPDGAGRADRQAPGEARADPPGDVHRCRAPHQDDPARQARGEPRRAADRTQPRGDELDCGGRRQLRASRVRLRLGVCVS